VQKTGKKSAILAHFRLESRVFRAVSFGLAAFSLVATFRLCFVATPRRFFRALAGEGKPEPEKRLLSRRKPQRFPLTPKKVSRGT
jgi:hypothetical protein